MVVSDTCEGTDKTIARLTTVGSYSNYTQMNDLSIPAKVGYTIKSIAVRGSNRYVFICYNVTMNVDGSATVTGAAFSCANSDQSCKFIADVIYVKDLS